MDPPHETQAVIKYDFIGKFRGEDYRVIQFPDSSDLHLFIQGKCYPEQLRKNPHLLPCFALNEDPKTMFLEIFDRPLSEHMAILRLQGVTPLITKVIPLEKKEEDKNENKSADDKLSKTKVWCVPKDYREFMRSMVQFLVSIHQKGYCTTGFSLPNIVMKDDAIKLFGLEFEEPDKTKFKDCVKQDFSRLHDVVSKIYSGFEDEFPPDFRYWLDNLRDHDGEVNHMLVNHLATLSSHHRLGFLRKVCENEKDMRYLFGDALNRIEQHQISKRKATRGSTGRWTARIKDNHGPLHSCLTFGQGGYKDTWKALMNFCRDYISHCNEHGEREFVPPRLFIDDFIDALLFYVFGEELCVFGAHRLKSANSNQPKDFRRFLPPLDSGLPSPFGPLIIHMNPFNPEGFKGQHSAFINYTLNPGDTQHNKTIYGSGKFSGSGIDFIIDSQSYSEDHKSVWSNTNPHMLHCFLIEDVIPKKMFLETLGYPLLYMVEELKKSVSPLVNALLPKLKDSNLEKKEIWYVPEKYRECMKSMVRFLVSIHKEGYCTQGFDSSNIIIKNNVVKFVGLKYEKLETEEFNVKKDFLILHAIVRKIFKGYEDRFPPDLSIWLKDLSNYDGRFQDMMVDHLATSSPSLRLRFLRDLSEEHGEMGKSIDYTLRHMSGSSGDWMKKITTEYAPLKYCFDKKSNDYASNEKQQFALIKFCRNYVAHYKDNEAEVEFDENLTEEVVDASLFHLFGEELCNIQKEHLRLSDRKNLPLGKRILEEMQDAKAKSDVCSS